MTPEEDKRRGPHPEIGERMKKMWAQRKAKESPPLAEGTPAKQTVDFARAFASIGMPMWSDELLGKVMAFSVATGFPPCTHRRPFYDVLMVAADRFNIKPGAIPDHALMKEYYLPRLKEIKAMKAETPWLPALMERYKIPAESPYASFTQPGWRFLDYSWAEDIATP